MSESELLDILVAYKLDAKDFLPWLDTKYADAVPPGITAIRFIKGMEWSLNGSGWLDTNEDETVDDGELLAGAAIVFDPDGDGISGNHANAEFTYQIEGLSDSDDSHCSF